MNKELSWAMKMLRHPNAANELRFALNAIFPVMTDPDQTREAKRQTLNMMVSQLSDGTFKLEPVVEQIITIINMKEEVSKEYASVDAQVEGILEWLPRMSEHKKILADEVKKQRKQQGLPL